MNLLLFIMTLVVSFIAVRIGAIAFELTGLEWSLAKFQALSCFTGTGFTTKEAELITVSPQRRRIASILIVLGHAGFVTLIATFANSLRPAITMPKFTIPFVHLVFSPQLLPPINLIIIVIFAFALYKIFTNAKFAGKLSDGLKARLIKKNIIRPVSFEELLVATGEYGVSSVEICKDSPILDKTLREANLRSLDITVLVIEKKETTIPNPSADIRVVLGDKLMCFGKLEDIRKKLCAVPE